MKNIFLLAFSYILCTGIQAQSTPDDLPAAIDAAIARLKAAQPVKVCGDDSKMSRMYGTSCQSREFQAPPLLKAPQIKWQNNPGWWGVWPPFVVGNLILTGSCNNDGNEGLSALDKNTGKIMWRIGNICATGNRRGSTGFVSFYELPSGEVLLLYPREDGKPADYYVIDVKTGKIVRSLSPVKVGPTRNQGGVFTVVNQTSAGGYSYISALSPDMSKVLWQNKDFALAMTDKLDPHYMPTFSPSAALDGMLFLTARSLDQPVPATRQLHAIDIKTGKTIWKHTQQKVVEKSGNTAYLSDDGNPIVANEKVIIRMQNANGESLRALDTKTGKILWNSNLLSGQVIQNRVAVGKMIVIEAYAKKERQVLGYSLADGKLIWKRKISPNARLLNSSGGVFYMGERMVDADNRWKESRFQGLDGETGTLLWTTNFPEHFLDISGETPWNIETKTGGPPTWVIDRDGAIYGVTLKGAYKLQ